LLGAHGCGGRHELPLGRGAAGGGRSRDRHPSRGACGFDNRQHLGQFVALGGGVGCENLRDGLTGFQPCDSLGKAVFGAR
jgi:hypothetical protein